MCFPFLPKFGWCLKSTVKIGILAQCWKQKKGKHILRGYYLVQVGVIIWSKLGALKNANLDQRITPEIFARSFFCSKTCVETSILQCFLTNNVILTKSDQIITPQKAKLGPDNNSTPYIYIYVHSYIYIYLFKANLSQFKVIQRLRFWKKPPSLCSEKCFKGWLKSHHSFRMMPFLGGNLGPVGASE